MLAKDLIAKGQLVPDDVILQIMESLISSMDSEEGGLIFDGFPRTVAQAEALNRILQKHNHRVAHFLELYVPDEELMDRLLKRGLEGGRADDTPETIKKRLELYHNTASPIAEFYESLGLRSTVEGTGTIAEITQRLIDIIAPNR